LGKQPAGKPFLQEVYKFVDIDREFKLPRGSAKKVFAEAAKEFRLKVVRQGNGTIVVESLPEDDDVSSTLN